MRVSYYVKLNLFGVYSWHNFIVFLADGVQACIAWLAFEKAEAWLETLPTWSCHRTESTVPQHTRKIFQTSTLVADAATVERNGFAISAPG